MLTTQLRHWMSKLALRTATTTINILSPICMEAMYSARQHTYLLNEAGATMLDGAYYLARVSTLGGNEKRSLRGQPSYERPPPRFLLGGGSAAAGLTLGGALCR